MKIDMKAELNKDVRIKRDLNYESLRSIEAQISERVRAEFANEVSAIRTENEKFNTEERSFHEQAKSVLKNATPQTLLRVKTQVGKGSTVVQEHTGYLERLFKTYDTYFNFISPDEYDGKPFTIGFSCLLSVELI